MTELNGTRITWLGHATFQITTAQGKVILIDPWLTGNPAFPADHTIDDVDLLLVTHGHDDHTTDVVAIAKKHSPTVIAIVEMAKGWLAPQGVEKLIDLNIGGSFAVEGITVTMTRAIHTSSVVVDGRLMYAG